MNYFLLHPDFDVLSRYYHFDKSASDMALDYKDGFDITIEPYKNRKQEWRFDEEHIQYVQQRFGDLIESFDLEGHYNNLLTLTLLKLHEIDEVYNLAYDRIQYQKRIKELAQLVLTAKNAELKHINCLVLKTLTDTAKVTDPNVISWIMSLITKSVNEGQVPYSVLGLEDMRMQTEEQMRAIATQSISSAHIKRPLADLCFFVYPYLINETNIRPDTTKLISDKMANFFVRVLSLFELADFDKIQSEPKDYIHSLLRNRIQKLNR